MNTRIMIAGTSLALLIGLAVACDEKKPETSVTDAAAVTGSAATATATAAPGAVETEEDFEDEAAASITADNLESEVAKLEAELK